MTPTWVSQAWLGVMMDHGLPTKIPLVIYTGMIGFAAVASWYDIRERRIPNVLNALGLMFFLVLQIGMGSGAGAVVAFLFVGTVMLVPTMLGLWGQGDWKMAMVCGAALGVLPALFVWWTALLFAKIFSVAANKNRLRWRQKGGKTGLPMAVFVLIASLCLLATLSFV